jgi:hypothetical protein
MREKRKEEWVKARERAREGMTGKKEGRKV